MQEKTNTSEELGKFLSFMGRNGLNTTAQRRIIAEAFFNYEGHHTLEEFYHHVQKLDRGIGQTTVYRTLKLLRDAGLAKEIHFTDGVTRYEVARQDSHHDHIMCMDCEKIVEIYDKDIENLQKVIAEKNHFTLLGHYHVLYGLCEDCRKAKEEGSSESNS